MRERERREKEKGERGRDYKKKRQKVRRDYREMNLWRKRDRE